MVDNKSVKSMTDIKEWYKWIIGDMDHLKTFSLHQFTSQKFDKLITNHECYKGGNINIKGMKRRFLDKNRLDIESF